MQDNPESRICEIFACGICNPAQDTAIPLTIGVQNPSSTGKEIRNRLPGIRNPLHGIENRRLSWIPLHGMICRQDRAVKKPTVTLMINFPSFTANT